VIKVWDRETLTLQASLHGHADFITDMDISKCNRFIASASKDAQIIIWELKTGKMIAKLKKHQQLINRVMFIAPKLKKQAPATSAPTAQELSVADLQTQFKQMTIENQTYGPESFQV
jgi:WD40 repeat protein